MSSIDFRDVVDAKRALAPTVATWPEKLADLAIQMNGRRKIRPICPSPIDADARAIVPACRLMPIETVRSGVASRHGRGKEHCRQRDIKWERLWSRHRNRRHNKQIVVDVGRLERGLRVPSDRRRIPRTHKGLDANNKIEVLAASVVQARRFSARETSDRTERLELRDRAQGTPDCWLRVRGIFSPSLLAASAKACPRGLGAVPKRASRVLETPRTDPAVLDRRVDIGVRRGRAPNERETKTDRS